MKKKSRLSLNLSHEEHTYLRISCAHLGMSIKDFLLLAAFERIEKIEDEWLAEKARETLENIILGKEKSIQLNELTQKNPTQKEI